MSLNSGLSQAWRTIYPLFGFVTRQAQSEDAPSAVAPLDQQSGIGKRLGLSHVLSTSYQSMNVCIDNAGGVLLYDYSCEDEGSDFRAGCGSNGREHIKPSLIVWCMHTLTQTILHMYALTDTYQVGW